MPNVDVDEIIDIELLRKKVDIYFILGTKVHIKKTDGIWKRGIIKEISADFFIIEEALQGAMPIFFQELRGIEPFREASG